MGIGVDRPKEYSLHSLEECIAAAKALNPDNTVTQEGFVVVDNQFHRVKVKSPAYFMLHHAVNNDVITKERIISTIRNGGDLLYIAKDFPQYAPAIYFYYYAYANLLDEIARYSNIVKALYEECSHDRKLLASKIKGHKYSKCGFMAIDHPEYTAEDMVDHMLDTTIYKLMPEYKREDFKEWFQ